MLTSERVPTGVPGLDVILMGGFLRSRVYLVQGDPGTGKTTLGLQYALECKQRGEGAIYVSLSENLSDLSSVASAHGWSIEGLNICDLSGSEDSLRADSQYTVFHPSEVELGETTQAVLDEVERVHPAHVIFDGLSEVRLLARDPLRYRKQLLALKQYFADKAITVLLLDDRSTPLGDIQPESVVAGVIVLEQHTPAYGGIRRRLHVNKVRGSAFIGGHHDYDITSGGVVVYPRLAAAAPSEAFERSTLGSGTAGLDAMLGGGISRGTSTLIMGPAGVGKSTVAIGFVASALRQGLKGAIYTFDEVVRVLVDRAEALGMPIRSSIDDGRLLVSQADPAELAPGAFASEVRHAVEQLGVRIVVIDSLNGYMNSMPEERFLPTHLHELFAYLNQAGVYTILVVAQHGLLGPADTTVEITYLADTVLLMRYFEAHGEVCQAIGVFKKRTGSHERSLRELTIGPDRIVIGEPLRQFRGVMTGVPQYGSSTDIRPEQRKEV